MASCMATILVLPSTLCTLSTICERGCQIRLHCCHGITLCTEASLSFSMAIFSFSFFSLLACCSCKKSIKSLNRTLVTETILNEGDVEQEHTNHTHAVRTYWCEGLINSQATGKVIQLSLHGHLKWVKIITLKLSYTYTHHSYVCGRLLLHWR